MKLLTRRMFISKKNGNVLTNHIYLRGVYRCNLHLITTHYKYRQQPLFTNNDTVKPCR